jgi:hypothetical protein
MENIAGEHADCVLVEIETEAKRVLGSFGPKEYDTLRAANILNGGHFNRVLGQLRVSYAPRPVPSSLASQAALNK